MRRGKRPKPPMVAGSRKPLRCSDIRVLDIHRLRREPEWTETLAVGDRQFVEAASRHFFARRSFIYAELPGENQVWTIKESALPYMPVLGMKTASKTGKASPKRSYFL